MRAPLALAFTLPLVACERGPTKTEVQKPREALTQLVHCALEELGSEPAAEHFEGALRHGLRTDRLRFATRAGACESALETPGGHHDCLARLRARWSSLLTVTQRPGVDAIDLDVAVRRAGEAYADALARCPR